LRKSWEGEVDVSSQHLEAAAEQLTVRRDNIQVIDAQQPKKEAESEKQQSPEEPEELKPNGEKEEKRGRKQRSPKEPDPPNPK